MNHTEELKNDLDFLLYYSQKLKKQYRLFNLLFRYYKRFGNKFN